MVVDVMDMLTCIENFVPSWRMGECSSLTDSELLVVVVVVGG